MNYQAQKEVKAYKLAQLLYDNHTCLAKTDGWDGYIHFFRLNSEDHMAYCPRPFGMKISLDSKTDTKPDFELVVNEILNRF